MAWPAVVEQASTFENGEDATEEVDVEESDSEIEGAGAACPAAEDSYA